MADVVISVEMARELSRCASFTGWKADKADQEKAWKAKARLDRIIKEAEHEDALACIAAENESDEYGSLT